jgi:uncharacterized membrane protein HdeD (DUF308 family)
MSTSVLLHDAANLRHHWGWLLTLGIAMVVLGAIAIYVMPAAAIGTVLVLGWLLVVSGLIESIYTFRVRRWGGFFLHLIGGILGIFIGLLVVTHPVAGALAWTLLFASFFIVIGICRLVTAISLKFDSLITVGLGILLWAECSWSGLWFLGLAVGASLILRGWSYVMFALAIRRLPVAGQLLDAA